MTKNESICLGIVGAAGRGGSFTRAVEHSDGVSVTAVCDLDAEMVEEAKRANGTDAAGYTDYYEMLWEADLDAVIIGTPQHLHVPQAVAALNRGLHVLSEVPAGVSEGECRDLVAAAQTAESKYMMAENYVYRKSVQMIRNIVEKGLFGELYYAEGEYLHELKDLIEQSRWRRTWAAGRNGNNYPTHSLGPILTWFGDDRVTRVACEGCGHHYRDSNGEPYEKADTTVFLAKTENDALIKIRGDIFSERPHAMNNYQLQGTAGCFESARASSESDRVWLATYEDAEKSGEYRWTDLESLEEEFLPDRWANAPTDVKELGHGGGTTL